MLAAIDRGDWDAWGEDFVERLAGVMRDSLAGRFDYDAATGRTAREEEIASCLAAMDAAAVQIERWAYYYMREQVNAASEIVKRYGIA